MRVDSFDNILRHDLESGAHTDYLFCRAIVVSYKTFSFGLIPQCLASKSSQTSDRSATQRMAWQIFEFGRKELFAFFCLVVVIESASKTPQIFTPWSVSSGTDRHLACSSGDLYVSHALSLTHTCVKFKVKLNNVQNVPSCT
jgi:hypothetical protein